MSRKKIALIGSGQIGGTLALLISQRLLGDIVLFDKFVGTAQGKALDLNQMCLINHKDCYFIGTNDYKDIKDADVCIITAGIPRKPGMSRDDLLKENLSTIKEVVLGIKTYCPNTFAIMITNPLDVMVYAFYAIAKLPKHKIVGMAGILDSARFSYFLANELEVSRHEVSTMVLGGHGDTMVALPRFSSVCGIPLTELINMKKISSIKVDEIINKTRDGGAEIVKLLGNGSAFYAPAHSALLMIESYLLDQKRILPCSVLLNHEYGVDDLFMGVPVVIGKNGVEKIIELDLNNEEKILFNKSKDATRKLIEELKRIL